MKLRQTTPWMPADEYGRSLRGLSVNLLVSNMERALQFQRQVLAAEIIYSDPDFAAIRAFGAEWMLHADHTYQDHPLHGFITPNNPGRGAGIELRLHGRDPDAATTAAHTANFTILAAPTDKPHGLREAFILDEDGYTWVPDIPCERG